MTEDNAFEIDLKETYRVIRVAASLIRSYAVWLRTT